MGSGLGVVFTFLAVYFGFFGQHNYAVLWLLALLSFVFAGYRVWRKEYRERIKAESFLERPKLTGFFQEIGEPTPYPYEDDGTGLHVLINQTGTAVMIYVRILNENSTPTTIHNFSLLVEMEGRQFISPYAEEWKPGDHLDILTPANIASHENAMVNLVSYLGDADKKLTHGVGIEGCLLFRVPDWRLVELLKPEGVTPVSLTLAIQDAWGDHHTVKDKWDKRPRPSQRIRWWKEDE